MRLRPDWGFIMKTHSSTAQRRQPGFILIEAMVALVVVAIGILGVAKLNTLLVQGAGYTKERAEALQLAQQTLEDMRNYDLAEGCDGVTFDNPADPIVGTNASYTLTVNTVPNVASAFVNVTACVTWNGGTCNAPGNRVLMNTVIACGGLGTATRVGADAEGGGGRSGFVKTPTGRARVGGVLDKDATLTGTDAATGTKSYLNADGTRVLVDKNGVVVLSMPKLSGSCEDEAPEFSSIEGKIYVEIDANKNTPLAAEADLFALSSDASFCSRQPIASAPVLTYAVGNKTRKFAEVDYKCFVGAEWWGNIGLVSTAKQVPPAARVCQGNPNSANIGTLFSKHPQMRTSRGYRGYRSLDANLNTWMSKGIGETDTKVLGCGDNQYGYTAVQYTGHHFVYAEIGSNNAADCAPVEQALSGVSGSKFYIANGDPKVTQTAGLVLSQAQNNPGIFYCMSSEDGLNCPKLEGGVFDPKTTLTGKLSGAVPPDLTLSLVDELNTATACTIASGKYTCDLNWTGFLGQTWEGKLVFGSTGQPLASLCSAPAPLTTDPVGVNVVYGVNQQDAPNVGNTVTLSNVPLYLKSLNIDLTYAASAGACGLAAPVAQWTNPSSSATLSTISWTAVPGAVGYRYTTCRINSKSEQTCEPGSPALNSSVANSPFVPLSMVEDDNRCYRFASVDAGSNVSAATPALLCVRYDKSKGKLEYSYFP